MARLDDIISGRSGYDCSAAASAKWSNGLGALSSSTFLVYKYIVRVCILCVCVCVCVCVCMRACLRRRGAFMQLSVVK